MTREWLNKNNVRDIDFSLDFIPKAKDRNAWNNISHTAKVRITNDAKRFDGYAFESLSAMDFLAFKRSGNRADYEEKSLKKRNALSSLVLAECVEYRGKYLDRIADGIWSICEESFWGVPAHNDGKALPDISEPIIDIFAAQTAGILCLAVYLLKDELDKIAPQIAKRVEHEMNERILTPFIESTDFWWMGYHRKDINNWNPWILSNLIYPFIMYERKDCIEKALYVLQPFLDYYSDEGSCDEGVTYWNVGGLSLFDFLDVLYLSTNARINFFDNRKIINIFTFIEKMYISDGQFVNFADAAPLPRLDIVTIFRMGKRINNSSIMALSRELLAFESEKNEKEYITLKRGVPDAFSFDELEHFSFERNEKKFTLISDIEVAVYRKGKLFLCVKGGHNGENHNHNDVGSFVLYRDGKPVFIDIGAPFYDARSFSENRYEIFSNTSNYHNLPIVNGKAQKSGSDAKALDFFADEKRASMKLDLCYGEKVEREFLTDGKIIIKDRFNSSDVSEVFITAEKPVITDNGVLVAGVKLSCSVPVKATVETIKLDDGRLVNSWGKEIYRLIFETENAAEIEFSVE